VELTKRVKYEFNKYGLEFNLKDLNWRIGSDPVIGDDSVFRIRKGKNL
jgi:hypothetical protein